MSGLDKKLKKHPDFVLNLSDEWQHTQSTAIFNEKCNKAEQLRHFTFRILFYTLNVTYVKLLTVKVSNMP